MEKTLENGEKFGGKSNRTKLKNDENLEENAQNASISWISSNQNDGATYGIYVTIYSAKNVMETMLKKEEKIGGKMHKKFLHKLNKQQTDWWHHVWNLCEQFIWKKVMETTLKKDENLMVKSVKNSFINCVSSK